MSDVLRWICDQYRTKLQDVSPDACMEIDSLMLDCGQGWVCDATVVDPDELITAADVEDRYGVRDFTVRALARRYGIKVQGKRDNCNLYRLGDVLAARAAKKSFDNCQ
jgi:hypothetical protein